MLTHYLIHATWNEVLHRDYEPWPQAHAVIETIGDSPQQSVEKMLLQIELKTTAINR